MDVNPKFAFPSPVGPSTFVALQNDIRPNTDLDIPFPSLEALNTSPVSSDVKPEGVTTIGTISSINTQSDPGVDTTTYDNTEEPIILATNNLPNPENFEDDLRSIKDNRAGFCIYQLSPDNTRLVRKDCEQHSDWGIFSRVFDRYTRGFAIYRLKDDSIDSIMKVSNRCRTSSYGPDRFNLLDCGVEEVKNLKKFTQWEPSLQEVFPAHWKSIGATRTLAAIGNMEGEYFTPKYPPGSGNPPPLDVQSLN